MRFLPATIDNDYRGRKAALWMFALVLFMKLGMSISSMLNGRLALQAADGVPIDRYPVSAAQTVVALFAIFAFAHFVLTALGALVLVRYRSVVPFMFAVLLFEQAGRKMILRFMPIERVGDPPAFGINLVLLTLMVVGLLVSLWPRRHPESAGRSVVNAAGTLIFVSFCVGAAAQATNGEAFYLLGREAMMRGDVEKAVIYLEKAVTLKPGNANFHYHLANAYGQSAASGGMVTAMSRGKKAKSELERAIQLDPNLLPARFALIEFHVQAPAVFGGSETAALEQAREIRKRDPIEGHRAFARIHTAAKKPELARKEYAEMLKSNPASARAHYFFAVHLMLTEKDYAASARELDTTLKDASYMPAHFRIGHLAVLSADNLCRGEESLRKYLAHQPKEGEPSLARAHYWLGGILEKQGKRAEAKASYAASLQINPNQKDVSAALERVS